MLWYLNTNNNLQVLLKYNFIIVSSIISSRGSSSSINKDMMQHKQQQQHIHFHGFHIELDFVRKASLVYSVLLCVAVVVEATFFVRFRTIFEFMYISYLMQLTIYLSTLSIQSMYPSIYPI